MKILVIVESPSKAKTIQTISEQISSDKFTIVASSGHIRDLPTNELGIDVSNKFLPKYVVMENKKKLLEKFKKQIQEHDVVYIASDNDREGEAIGWHLIQTLKCKRNYKRVLFNEITRSAIKYAYENPKTIDCNLVDAQQARRIIDRLVGYKISPLLWNQFQNKHISAGRVQSTALNIICEREIEIKGFESEPYWITTASFTNSFNDLKLCDEKLQPIKLKTKEAASNLLNKLLTFSYYIENLKTKDVSQNPCPPLITSTLQQEASKRFNLPVTLTMKIAQELYEAGCITYMRTDNTNLSSEFKGKVHNYVIKQFGNEFCHKRDFKTKSKNAQEAHEAIRPCDIYLTDDKIQMSHNHKKIYKLVRNYALASQMKSSIYNESTLIIRSKNTNLFFVGKTKQLKFPGFKCVFRDDEEEVPMFPPIQIGSKVQITLIECKNMYAQKPCRFTEASFINTLETFGIGRPSTYATTIHKLFEKKYVNIQDVLGSPVELTNFNFKDGVINTHTFTQSMYIDKKKIVPTELGFKINNYLKSNFDDIFNIKFTSSLEEKLDLIAAGKHNWTEVISEVNKKLEDNATYTIRLAKYGHVIQMLNPRRYINLEPILAITKKNISELSKYEIDFLIKLPIKLSDSLLCLGPYGFYLQHNGKNFKIPNELLDCNDIPSLKHLDISKILRQD